MVMPSARGFKGEPDIQAHRTLGRVDAIRDFLERELPPGRTTQIPYLTEILLDAAERYERYAARRDDWIKYAWRRNRLLKIAELARELASNLCKLDILSRDDLGVRQEGG
jgi:hypothetical protein